MSAVVLTWIILLVPIAGLCVIARWDSPVCVKLRCRMLTLTLAFGEGMLISILFGEHSFLKQMILGIFAGCLLLACITDSALCQVYNFVWWPGVAVGSVLLIQHLWQQGQIYGLFAVGGVLVQLILFCFLQFLVFGRMYGRADSYAFCTCAVLGTSLGMTMEGYWLHMILSYLLLILMQVFRRNISARGCLKRPVPFLPYINIGFWVTLILLSCHN